jgi:hypothetical protein
MNSIVDAAKSAALSRRVGQVVGGWHDKGDKLGSSES